MPFFVVSLSRSLSAFSSWEIEITLKKTPIVTDGVIHIPNSILSCENANPRYAKNRRFSADQNTTESTSSIGITVPSSMTRTLSAMEMCRTTPVTVTYAPPDFRSSGTKYSMVTSGRSFSRVARSVRRRFSSSASCGSSSRLLPVSRAVSPYRRFVARQRGKWREQRGTVEHHIRSYRVLRIVLKRVNEVSVVQKN